MSKSIARTVAIVLAALGLLSSQAEAKEYKNIPLSKLQMACINSGGTTTPGKGSGGTGCKQDIRTVSCDKTGTCSCTGICPRRTGGLLNVVQGAKWHGPKSPPKATGTRPLDNKWHGPTSVSKSSGAWNQSRGSDGTGPILKSGGGKR